MRTIDEIKVDIARYKAVLLSPINQSGVNLSAIYEDGLRRAEDELRAVLTANIPLHRLEAICAAEKDGRCVALPCKAGGTVYVIIGKVHAGVVKRFLQDADNSIVHIYVDDATTFPYDTDELGKRWFLTREEAEAALNSQSKTEE